MEDFSWIDNIFLEEEEEGLTENNPTDQVFTENVIDVDNTTITETRKEEIEDVPPPM